MRGRTALPTARSDRLEIRSDRRFHFDVPRVAFWAAVAAVEDYRGWWPWLRLFEARSLTAGDVWTCQVQPPLPYALRFTLRLEEVVPVQLIRATVSGDLDGEATLEVLEDASEPNSCQVRLRSALTPAATLPRLVATAAPGVARFGHDWILDTGIRQFRDRARRTAVRRPPLPG
jgi:uncharacterized protein YndB with AHSA1/START domain